AVGALPCVAPYGRAGRQDKIKAWEPAMNEASDPIDQLPDAVAAAAFRRLVRHLRHRHDAQNIDLMGLAGFCRNCLADWIRDGGVDGDTAAAVEVIHGALLGEWKALAETEAMPEQIARTDASVGRDQGTSPRPGKVFHPAHPCGAA